MTVKHLIAVLKKMPQNLQVGIAHHDNSAFEISGWVCYARHEVKADFDSDADRSADRNVIADQPDEWVVLRC